MNAPHAMPHNIKHFQQAEPEHYFKVHLTPKNFFRSIESTRYSKHLLESSIFYALSKSRLKCCTTQF